MANSSTRRFDEADFRGRATRIREQIRELTTEQRKEVRAHDRNLTPRLEKALDYILMVGATVDPDLLSEEMVSNLVAEMVNIESAWSDFMESGGSPYLQQIELATDGMLDALGSWVGVRDSPTYDAIRKAASSYRRSLGQQLINSRAELRGLEQAFSVFRKSLDEKRKEIENDEQLHRERIEGLIETVQSQTDQVAESVSAQAARLDQTSTTYQQQFADAQERRATEFQETMTELAESASVVRNELNEHAKEFIDAMAEERDKAKDLVGVIAATGTASVYGKEAQQQKYVADILRNIAIFIGLVASGLAVWVAVAAATGDAAVGRVLARVVATIALLGIAGYVASQSASHRRREERAKRRELDLVAFGPFIADLQETDQHVARKELVAKLFGNESEEGLHESPSLTKENISLVGQLLDTFSKLRK